MPGVVFNYAHFFCADDVLGVVFNYALPPLLKERGSVTMSF